MKINFIIFLCLFGCTFPLFSQNDSLTTFDINADFRFRLEQDWNSQKSDGTLREDRTRMRYRARLAATYHYKEWATLGLRIRTGDPRKQQDPHLTLGEGFKEFGTLPIAFEKAYAKFDHKWFSGWIGKNTFPFQKQNELFWNDNVFPEGVALSANFQPQKSPFKYVTINTGHFIVASNNSSFDEDAYFQGLQVVTAYKDIFQLFPSFYYFKNIPNIPDGNDTFTLDYAIFHVGTNSKILRKPDISLALDYYHNLQDYSKNDSIQENLRNEKAGYTAAIIWGNHKKKGDCALSVTYAYKERFSIVDFLAQNDWARWDYSSQGSPDSRLSNFKGFDVLLYYALTDDMNLQLRYFHVDQLVPYGDYRENGDRIRLDLNISF